MNVDRLTNSLKTFKMLLQKVATYDRELEAQLIKARDYEELDRYILCHLSGTKY